MKKRDSLLKYFKPTFKAFFENVLYKKMKNNGNNLEMINRIYFLNKVKINDLVIEYDELKQYTNNSSKVTKLCINIEQLLAEFKYIKNYYYIRDRIFNLQELINKLRKEIK